MGSKEVEILKWPKATLPLSQVPGPEHRMLALDLLNTAGHELNHAIVAIASGATVISVSVRPMGDSLGRTVFAGHLSPEVMKVVAAAGSVATHDGCAHGYGDDMYHVGVLTHLYGGMSKERAVNQAEAFISQYSSQVRKKAAEIIAYWGTQFGDISGSMISTILARAQIELNLEKGILDHQFVPEQNIEHEVKEAKEAKDRTVIDYLKDGSYKVTYIVGGIIEKEELICNICKGVDSHYESCLKSKNIKEDFPINRDKTPQEAVIFTRT